MSQKPSQLETPPVQLTERVGIRLTAQEKELMERVAQADGRKLSNWIRVTLLRRLARLEKEHIARQASREREAEAPQAADQTNRVTVRQPPNS